MGIFESDWQKLHKKLSREYELIALRNYESGISSGTADVFGIITEIVSKIVPTLSNVEAAEFVKKEYQSFQNFDVRESIGDALRQMNPDVPEAGVSEIFDAVRCRFCDPQREHEYFLFFVISKLVELQNLSITRGAYLIEISRGRIPRPSRFVRFFQMWRQIAHYQSARDRREGNRVSRTRNHVVGLSQKFVRAPVTLNVNLSMTLG
jgi:hypothetical protein